MYVVLLASALGTLLGIGLFKLLQSGIASQYLISLPTPNILTYSLVSCVLIFLISAMSFIPAVRKSLELNPKQILIGGDDTPRGRRSFLSLAVITFSTLVPLVLLASFLLQSILQGALVIGGIAVIYIFVAIAYTFFIRILYKQRKWMPFFLRSIVSQKYADGLFGVVSFASLFVALTALCTLALTQVSLERFLTNDLTQTIPSTYILDVQPSQKDELAENFPQIELFSNVRARIIAIDELRIQDELAAGNLDVSGELGREFNLTARNELLQSESIVDGEWSAGKTGEISVDEEFAKQADIEIGSKITFSIQGFEVSGTVTSFRSTDSRSGLPFFYFVLSPEDIDMFPSVYFGYAYIDADIQASLGRFIANNMSNVSVLETQALGPLLLQLVGTLLILVLIVTLPPLLIATLLIAMLVVSSYATRRRDGARLRALGMTRKRSFWLYILETLSVASLASIFAYGIGVLVTLLVNTYFLKLDVSPIYDTGLIVGLGLIIFFIFSIALYLYKTDTLELKEILSHE
jgi:putative ABC transport system permease protein